MIVSEARIAANRRNAQKSTGPRTVEGKSVSRANALKHGLCSAVVVPEDASAVQARAVDLYHAFRPRTGYQAWHVDRAAIVTLRIERIERMERRVRDKVSLRAELSWDDDRRLEAEMLGGMLANRPAQTVEQLRATPHGCDWLMVRWALLAHAADAQDGHAWTPEQARLAYDLLATPPEFRNGHRPGADVDLDGRLVDKADDSAAVARRMLAELKERRAEVAALDEVDRALAAADLDHESGSELRRLRRYESTLHRRLRWMVGQMQAEAPAQARADGSLFPTWKAGEAPPEKPEPESAEEEAARKHDPRSFSPPFCLTPDEAALPPQPDGRPDVPAILSARKEKQRQKAEARRQSQRRKAERLHAKP